MKIKFVLIALSIVFLGTSGFAGIESQSWELNRGRRHNKFTLGKSVTALEADVFSEAVPFQKRWKLVSEVVSLKTEKKAQVFLKRCLESEKWFLQSAALKVLVNINPGLALTYADKLLLSAKALVVRSEAVEVIASLGGPGETTALWKALNSGQNFRRRKSLWIRPQIAKVIHKLERSNHSRAGWTGLLNDSDKTIQAMAQKVLKAY